ncbi:agmatinase [Primorskyibacter flagellatus]|uniref:Agmatinase n=1 Tax=Primorskyibacter flagellatus TaxID=1387277 RepID=A0A917EBM2_9RHOB|nr:agmatinase [Primorskyibacter flagellatus]GGE21559.1 agmatinase [Primorskyibacter flagellatus]
MAKTLEELHALYGNDKGTAFHDPRLKAVADGQFGEGGRRAWPFAGVSTLLDAPYRPDLAEAVAKGAAVSGIDVALIGVPMDLGVTNRAGARRGPKAVREIERIGPWNRVLDVAPLQVRRFADLGGVPMRSRYDLTSCHEDIEDYFTKVVQAGLFPLAVGGDHSISRPVLAALAKKHGPVGMVHIDAHADTSGVYEGAKFHHGGPFRQAVLEGSLDPTRTIQIGIRGGGDYLWEFSYASGMTVIHAEEVAEMGVPAVVARALEVIGAGPTYISFDVDSLDPAYAPGTGTPEVGGLEPREAMAILRGLKGLNMVGGDVVEVAPSYDPTSNTAQAGAQILFELACLAVLAPE